MVDCALARPYFCLAPRDSTARDQFRGRTAALLDGRGFYSTAVSGPTPGLLFNEHVERIRAVGSRCIGEDTAGVTCRRCNRCRTRRHDDRGGGILSCRRGPRSERKLGNNGRALDRLEGVARYASFNMAGISTFGCGLWHVAHLFVAGSPVPYFQAARKTCGHRPRRIDDSGRPRHDGCCLANRPLFFTCRCGAISKSTAGCRRRYNL